MMDPYEFSQNAAGHDHKPHQKTMTQQLLVQKGLTREHLIWAYRILLDRDPESEAVIIDKMNAWNNTRDLRIDIMNSPEFRENNRDLALMNDKNIVIKEIDGGWRLFVDLADYLIGLNIV